MVVIGTWCINVWGIYKSTTTTNSKIVGFRQFFLKLITDNNQYDHKLFGILVAIKMVG
jgi:hypothetical protein